MNQYTSGQYLEKNAGWHQEDSSWKATQILKIMRHNNINPTSVVDLGCGSGKVLHEMSNYLGTDIKFTGFDISPQAIEIAKTYLRPNLEFSCGNLFEADLPKQSVLLAIDVFEHVEDPIGFLRNCHGRAKYYIFHIPLEMHIQGLLRDIQIRTRDDLGHLHYFSKATGLRTLTDSGYTVIDWFYTHGSLDLRGGRLARVANLVRKPLFRFKPDLAVKLLGGFSIMVLAVTRDNAELDT